MIASTPTAGGDELRRHNGLDSLFTTALMKEHAHDWTMEQIREAALICSNTLPDVQELADCLITTLDSLMPSEKADAIVRDVATELYTDVLGVPGEIVVDTGQPTGIMHGGFGPNGKRVAVSIARYKFERKQTDA